MASSATRSVGERTWLCSKAGLYSWTMSASVRLAPLSDAGSFGPAPGGCWHMGYEARRATPGCAITWGAFATAAPALGRWVTALRKQSAVLLTLRSTAGVTCMCQTVDLIDACPSKT